MLPAGTSAMSRIIGIDLGTTNTAVAVLEGGRPRVIEDDRGYKVLPSVVSAKGDGRFVVGQAAHNLILTHPDRTVYGCKRLMGRRFDSPEVEAIRKRVQYDIREAPDGGVQVLVGDQWMSPQEVAAVVLQVARTIAERGLGEPIDEAVITVPAYFNHAQRKATLEAAQLAGLRCERLLNEPTAAALAYGHRKNVNRTIAVFDLGGGTFDISVLHLSEGIYEILATAGDTFLGGEDFDWRVAEWLADVFQSRTGVDLREDRGAVQRLKDAAERAKCELSFSDQSNIVIPRLTATDSIDVVLTRSKLEELTVDLIERACDIARRAVIEAGLQMSELDEVVLVGGQTRMPKAREMVAGVFGRDPSRTVHPEEAVAVGAAVHAANLGNTEAEKVVLLDVTPFEVGIDTTRGTFVPVLERNTRIPVSASRTFATVHDQQTTVRITIRQGLSRTASENEFLGEFLFEGLTPAPRLHTKVDVGFRIDSNGMLHVTATEKATGERRQITIRNYAEHAATPKLPDPEMARLDAEARARRAADDARAGAPTKKAASAGVGEKKGFLDALFRRKGKAAGATKPAAGVAAAVTPVAAAAATAGSTAVQAAGAGAGSAGATAAAYGAAPPATIDLADVELGDVELVDDTNTFGAVAAPRLDPLDEEVLYEETGAASLGLAGHGSGDLLPVSMDELFGPGHEAGPGDPFGGDPFGTIAPVIENPFADDPPSVAGRAAPQPLSTDAFFSAEVDEPTSEEDRGLTYDPRNEDDDIFATGDGLDDGGVEVFGEDFALVADEPPLAASENPFGADEHTQIDHEAVAALQHAAPENLATATEVAEDLDVEPVADPEGALGLDELFGDLAAPPEAEPAPEAEAESSGMVLLPETDLLSDVAPDVEAFPSTEVASFGMVLLGEDELGSFLSEAHVDLGGEDEQTSEAPSLSAERGARGEQAPPDPSDFEEDLRELEGSELDLSTDTVDDLFGADSDPYRTAPADPAPEAPPELVSPTEDSGSVFNFPPSLPPVSAAATGFARVDPPPLAAEPNEWSTVSEVTRLTARPDSVSGASRRTGAERRRKPARVKLQYRDFEVFVTEYRENLRRGGTFIRTEKPLPVGRECLFEIGAPGLDVPLVFPALVTFVATAAPGQEAGMGVEYQLDDNGRREIERVLNRT